MIGRVEESGFPQLSTQSLDTRVGRLFEKSKGVDPSGAAPLFRSK